jgi:hypothetical protein
MRLLIRTVLASLDENTHEASGHRSANIGFRVVPNHRDIFDSAPQAFDGEFEERRRGLSQHGGFSTGSVFQRRDERACVETEFAIVIEEVAVFGQGEKLGPLKNIANGACAASASIITSRSTRIITPSPIASPAPRSKRG